MTTVEPTGQPQISVVIVDDHLLVADSIAMALNNTDDITVLDIAGTCAAGLATVGRLRPDVLLLDQRLPDGLGTSVIADMLTVSPLTRVLLVTAADSDEVLTKAIEAGAVGVITKGKRAESLVKAVRAAANDEPVITPGDAAPTAAPARASRAPAGGRSDQQGARGPAVCSWPEPAPPSWPAPCSSRRPRPVTTFNRS